MDNVYNGNPVHSPSWDISWDLTKLANNYLPIIPLSFIISDDCFAWVDHQKLFPFCPSFFTSIKLVNLDKPKVCLCGLKPLCLSPYTCLACYQAS